jgi:hypothetical protein
MEADCLGHLERGFHAVDIVAKGQMLAGFFAVLNDLIIQGAANQANGVAVAASGKCHGRAHHARADYSDDCHNFSPFSKAACKILAAVLSLE